jgi:hypothetical protein
MKTEILRQFFGILKFAAVIIILLLVFKRLEISDNVLNSALNKHTDSLIAAIAYKIPKIQGSESKPTTVIRYTPPISTNTLSLDSVLRVVDSLNKRIAEINPVFITYEPQKPKLLYAKFTDKSIALDLLRVDGSIYRDNFNVDYTKYDYEWQGTNLVASGRKYSLKTPQKITLWSHLKYEILQGEPEVGLEVRLNLFKHLELAGQTSFYYTSKVEPKIAITLSKQLK